MHDARLHHSLMGGKKTTSEHSHIFSVSVAYPVNLTGTNAVSVALAILVVDAH